MVFDIAEKRSVGMSILQGKEPLREVKDILDLRISGQDKQKMMLFSLMCSYKTLEPAHSLLVGESSAGKSWTMNNVMLCFPIGGPTEIGELSKAMDEKNNGSVKKVWTGIDGLSFTRVSSQALKRFGSDAELSWDNKILCLPELDGATTAEVFLRCAMSEGTSVSLTTEGDSKIGFHSKIWIVHGKPLVVATTASKWIEPQFAARCTLIPVSTVDQRQIYEKIVDSFSDRASDPFLVRANVLKKDIKNIPIFDRVIIPFSKDLPKIWPVGRSEYNRSFKDFLRLICSVAVLHYKNRSVKGKVLYADYKDYDLARQMYCGMTQKVPSKLLIILQKLRADNTRTSWTVADAVSATGFSYKSVQRSLSSLAELGVLKLDVVGGEEFTRKYVYTFSEFGKSEIVLPKGVDLFGSKGESYEVFEN